jgi:predicted nucleotidyltransferase
VPTIRSLDPGAREALFRELTSLAARLVTDLGVDAVYVFGSLARGHQHEGSDVDLLVVADYRGRSIDLIGEILRWTDLPVEPIVVRPATLDRRLRERHPLFTRIMAEAVRLA